jgi:hypothetical protein
VVIRRLRKDPDCVIGQASTFSAWIHKSVVYIDAKVSDVHWNGRYMQHFAQSQLFRNPRPRGRCESHGLLMWRRERWIGTANKNIQAIREIRWSLRLVKRRWRDGRNTMHRICPLQKVSARSNWDRRVWDSSALRGKIAESEDDGTRSKSRGDSDQYQTLLLRSRWEWSINLWIILWGLQASLYTVQNSL